MRLLAAWIGNPEEYWMNMILLIVFVAAGVYALRKLQASRRGKGS